MAFLVSCGYSYEACADYEDGMSIDELYFHLQEAQKVALAYEKRQVQSMAIAVASLFKGDVLKKYFASVDKVLAQDSHGASLAPPAKSVQSSLRELSKLTGLLGRG